MANTTSSGDTVGYMTCKTAVTASTPPDRRSELPLTPPGTDDRPATLDFDIENAIELFGNSLDRTQPEGLALQVKLQPQQYEQLVREIECNPKLRRINDKVR